MGLAVDVYGNYPLVDMASGNLLILMPTAQQPPVVNPQIGIVVMTTNFFGDLVTQLNPVVNSTFNNDVKVAILAEEGTETSYTLDPNANFPDDSSSRITPLAYTDGLLEWNNSIVIPAMHGSNVLVRAVGTQDGRRPSDVISARFQFKVANPVINGKNPGNFTLSDGTEDAQLWYTIDGSAPTNSAPSRLYLPDSHLNIVDGTNDIPFKVRAFKAGYTPSAEESKTFLFTDLETSAIGIPGDYGAGIGSTIVVPIEVRVAGADAVRSLQFRVEVVPNDGAPQISSQFRILSISTNDFIPIPAPSTNPPISKVYFDGTTTGLEIAYIGESSGLKLTGTAVAALLAVPIPPTATAGQSYTIRVVQPSGTSDANQSSVPFVILDDRFITVADVSYLVGDSGVAYGYNAGDFGNGNLNNNDVNNAFHVSLGLYSLFPFTDLFDAMDAFPPDSSSTVGGDGQIRFLDWQLILNRSLRLTSDTLNWQRAWAPGGVRVPATATLNDAADMPGQTLVAPAPGAVWVRQACLSAASLANVQPGQTVQVPLYIKVAEGSSVSGLQFLAKIVPAPAAPALTERAQFVPAAGVPVGRWVDRLANNQVAYAWDLDTFNPLLEGRVLLGNVVFTVPATALAGQVYRVCFGNADGAPNVHTQYDFETFAAAVVVGAPVSPTQDPISDEWKTHFFGSVDNAQAASNADPDKDGSPNWQEFLAGTDPTDPHSHLHLMGPMQRADQGRKQVALKWLSAPGKHYLIESSSDLTPGTWKSVTTGVAGDGTVKEFLDTNAPSTTRYYRVRLQE
jgi:hypothetical protein